MDCFVVLLVGWSVNVATRFYATRAEAEDYARERAKAGSRVIKRDISSRSGRYVIPVSTGCALRRIEVVQCVNGRPRRSTTIHNFELRCKEVES